MGKYITRENSLRNKINEELSHPTPETKRIIEIFNEFEVDNIKSINKLKRIKKMDDKKIIGALKQTINAHGPITYDFLGSATKRINGALMVNRTFNGSNDNNLKSIKNIIIGFIFGIISFYLFSFY